MYYQGDYQNPSFAISTPSLHTEYLGSCPDGTQLLGTDRCVVRRIKNQHHAVCLEKLTQSYRSALPLAGELLIKVTACGVCCNAALVLEPFPDDRRAALGRLDSSETPSIQ